MTIREKLERITDLDWESVPVVMPLTTCLSVMGPDDIVGMGIIDPWTRETRVITIENRDWEGSAQYTGLTADLYEASAVSEKEFVKEITGIMRKPGFSVAMADRIVTSMAMAVGADWGMVIPLAKAVRYAETGGPPEALTKQFEESGEALPARLVVGSIVLTKNMPRMLGRAALARRIAVPWDDMARPEIPTVGSTLALDAAIWRACLAADENTQYE